jgi:hypothetical protein
VTRAQNRWGRRSFGNFFLGAGAVPPLFDVVITFVLTVLARWLVYIYLAFFKAYSPGAKKDLKACRVLHLSPNYSPARDTFKSVWVETLFH